jgi:hypothetical protein
LVFPSLEKGGEIGAPYFILYSKNDCQHGFLLLADFLPVGQEEYPGLPGGGGSLIVTAKKVL